MNKSVSVIFAAILTVGGAGRVCWVRFSSSLFGSGEEDTPEGDLHSTECNFLVILCNMNWEKKSIWINPEKWKERKRDRENQNDSHRLCCPMFTTIMSEIKCWNAKVLSFLPKIYNTVASYMSAALSTSIKVKLFNQLWREHLLVYFMSCQK